MAAPSLLVHDLSTSFDCGQGHTQTSRLAFPSRSHCYVAVRDRVVRIKVESRLKAGDDDDDDDETRPAKRQHTESVAAAAASEGDEAGADSSGVQADLPPQLSEFSAADLAEPLPPLKDQRGGLYGVAAAVTGSTAVVASVDAFGTAHVQRGDSSAPVVTWDGYSCRPPAASEPGWHGVDISVGGVGDAAAQRTLVTSLFGMSLDVYDGEARHSRRLQTIFHPTRAQFVGGAGSPLLACTEYNQASLYDLRVSGNGGCVFREKPTPLTGWLYGLSACDTSTGLAFSSGGGSSSSASSVGSDLSSMTIVVGGADCNVTAIDARNWKVRSRWKAPLKHEVVGMAMSTVRPFACYVAGLDNKVMCGSLAPKEHPGKKMAKDKKAAKKAAAVAAAAAAAAADAGGRQEKETEQEAKADQTPAPAPAPAARAASTPALYDGSNVTGTHPPVSKLAQIHNYGFRGDSRWVGMAVAAQHPGGGSGGSSSGGEVVCALSDTGRLYVCNHSEQMLTLGSARTFRPS